MPKAEYLDEHGMFTAPAVIKSLGDVPSEFQEMYAPRAAVPGKWFLTEEGKQLKAEFQAKLAEVLAERQATEAMYDARLAKRDMRIHEMTVSAALNDALARAAVTPALRPAAAAVLRASTKFEVEEADTGDGEVVLAATPYGLHSVEGVVATFLDSDDGAAFKGKRSAPSDGYFSGLVAELKQRR